ncbi:MAG: Outer membrane protein [uncultured Sulfurovum sp.]|uniref:Outer membrane protein n=1 Tax=uncultured Sulfurovum sp. TaxID=269237 RepID=A0A6S6SCY2_9BACT|nr:MAG: Outer membrane protein [uncultured Sulfurovum sp.]
MKNIFLSLLLFSTLHSSESKYELGLGMGVVTYPSYIGSKSSNEFISPLPYIRYESGKTKLGRGGLQYKFFDSKDLTLDLSLGGSLPVDSENAKSREGMNDLDFALEVGPRLNYRFYKDEHHKVSFKLPLRAVISTDIKEYESQGFLVAPNLNYRYKQDKFQFKLKTGPIWADKTYHNYFYGVTPNYATAQRQAYDAEAGYNGYRNTISFKYKQDRWNYGAFASHFNIDGTSFEDSPLVETKSALFLGTFISYTFYKN